MATLSGGAKLAAKLAELAKVVDNPASLKVGFLANAKYPDGTYVAMVAAIQDFGAPRAGIPPRPFFRNMIAKNEKQWPADIVKLVQAEDYDARRALRLMGEQVRDQIQQSIRDTNTPPLKPATIARKGFAKPLIDTGKMLDSVDFEIK